MSGFKEEGRPFRAAEPVPPRKPETPEEWAAFWARLDAMTDEPFPEREPQPEWRDIDLDP